MFTIVYSLCLQQMWSHLDIAMPLVEGQAAKAPAMALPMVTGIKFFTKISPQLSGAPDKNIQKQHSLQHSQTH
jgi:hypothetical protein